ncbi:DUF721 domain-containing protein [Brevibacterium litoralis]|uniref:DUF721 domain-containing protein n=1 Tax=Brevibacterium litoralis TaxID=3138935 RepID=UPI0032EF5525
MSTALPEVDGIPVALLEALDRVRRMPTDGDAVPVYRGPRRNVGALGKSEPTYSSARPDPRDPQPIGVTLGGLTERQGWRTSLDVGSVIGRWPELVGEDVAAHCTPESFEPPVLVVRAVTTTWATQLRIMKVHLLDRLERELGSRVVEEIEILGPIQKSWKKGPRSVKGRGPRDTYG